MSNFDFDALFGAPYLKADDIDDETGLILTIEDYAVEQIGPEKDTKCLLEFREIEKRLVLNVTNGRVLGELFGKEADNWIGKKIKLTTEAVTFAGKTTLGVRIFPKKLKQAQQKPEPPAEFEETEEVPY